MLSPEIAWRKIAKFRNVVAHDYLGVNLDKVWKIVKTDLLSWEDKYGRFWTISEGPKGRPGKISYFFWQQPGHSALQRIPVEY
jgi:hypothetical protein